jgi:hypothetical protein
MVKTVKNTIINLTLMYMLVIITLSYARADNNALAWNQLSKTQQAVLKNFQQGWEDIPYERRQRLVTGATRWNEMTPEQRARAKDRLQQWKNSSDEDKEKMRQRMKEFRQLPLELKQALRKKYQWFTELPEAEQQQLRNRWQNESAEKKQQIRERMRSTPTQTPMGQHRGLPNHLNQHRNGTH